GPGSIYGSHPDHQELSPDGAWFLAGRSGRADLWDTATGRRLGTFRYRGRLTDAWLDPARLRVGLHASANDEATDAVRHSVSWFDATTGRPLHQWDLEQLYRSWYSPLSGIGRRIELGFDGQETRFTVHDLLTGGRIGEAQSLKGNHELCGSSRDGRRFGTADRQDVYRAQVWDSETGRPESSPWEHGGPVGQAEFHPGGEILATLRDVTKQGAENRQVCLWDVATGRLLKQLPAPRVESIAFDPDGLRLA